MGIKQIPLAKFVNWLEFRGLIIQHSSTNHSSHTYYNYPEEDPRRLLRNVCVRHKYKEIPQLHIHTNLQTMGVSKKIFEREIKDF
jgi:hypothetical protein